MYERILLATDGERGAAQATDHAIALAGAVGANLSVLYVVDETIYGAYAGDEFVQEHEGPEAALEALGEDTLDAVEAAATDAGVTVDPEMRRGHPTEEILKTAASVEADLIVLGTHRKSSEFRQLLGSVTGNVVRLSERPTLVVKN